MSLLLQGLDSSPITQGLAAPFSQEPVQAPGQPTMIYTHGADTSSLDPDTLRWARPGNSRPDAGYLQPLFPKPWFRNSPNATSLFTSLDNALENGRFYVDVLRASHTLGQAVGGDLDDLAALFGLTRITGETDNQLRRRIPATVQHGSGASTLPAMASYLSVALQVPVEVRDLTPGVFQVTLLGTSPLYKATTSLVKGVKVAGTQFKAVMLTPAPNPQQAVFGAFRFGDMGVGDSGIFIPIQ